MMLTAFDRKERHDANRTEYNGLIGSLGRDPVSAQVQGVDLNGQYRCVAQCLGPPGSFAFITQNGWELYVINDAGESSRGWVDYPGRIWIRQADQGAIYSPDGSTIQFDRGTIWQRAPLVPPPRR